MLKAVDESVSQTARRIVSRESASNAPALKIRYRPGPQLTISEPTNSQICVTFQARPGRAYALESRTPLSGDTWDARTNLAAQPVATLHVFKDTTGGTNQFYRVRTSAP